MTILGPALFVAARCDLQLVNRVRLAEQITEVFARRFILRIFDVSIDRRGQWHRQRKPQVERDFRDQPIGAFCQRRQYPQRPVREA